MCRGSIEGEEGMLIKLWTLRGQTKNQNPRFYPFFSFSFFLVWGGGGGEQGRWRGGRGMGWALMS